MSQARIDYMQESAWKRNSAKKMRPMPPFELPYAKDAVLIDLPEPDLLPDAHVNFLEMIELRSTLRQYDDTKELTKKELSYLLWCTQGVKMVMQTKTVRNVPSAGGRNALETFLYIRRVEDIKPGLYRFLPLEHKLVLVSDSENIETDICGQFSTSGEPITPLSYSSGRPYMNAWRACSANVPTATFISTPVMSARTSILQPRP